MRWLPAAPAQTVGMSISERQAIQDEVVDSRAAGLGLGQLSFRVCRTAELQLQAPERSEEGQLSAALACWLASERPGDPFQSATTPSLGNGAARREMSSGSPVPARSQSRQWRIEEPTAHPARLPSAARASSGATSDLCGFSEPATTRRTLLPFGIVVAALNLKRVVCPVPEPWVRIAALAKHKAASDHASVRMPVSFNV